MHQTQNAARGILILEIYPPTHAPFPAFPGASGCSTIADNRAWSAAAFLQQPPPPSHAHTYTYHPRGTCQPALRLIKLQRSNVCHADVPHSVLVDGPPLKSRRTIIELSGKSGPREELRWHQAEENEKKESSKEAKKEALLKAHQQLTCGGVAGEATGKVRQQRPAIKRKPQLKNDFIN